jgi:gluconate 2-dehydrogenase gamma chain
MADDIKRSEFVKLVGVLGISASLATDCAPTTPSKAPGPSNPAQKALDVEPEAYTFFTVPEQAFVNAACDRLIPADDAGPSASAAGVPFYIDQQLAGAWGNGARFYRQGPWQAGTPEQGYQLGLLPKDLYRTAIRSIDRYCSKKYLSNFSELTAAQQDDVLHSLEKGAVDLDAFPSATFFSILLANTIEGYFADPLYGGNRGKAGWKMIGFPGVAAVYSNLIEQYNKPYVVTPVSIADVQQGLAVDGMDSMHVTMVSQMHPTARNRAKGR